MQYNEIFAYVALACAGPYYLIGLAMQTRILGRQSVWNTVWVYAKWTLLVAITAGVFTDVYENGALHPAKIFIHLWNFVMWYSARNAGDDDTWKKTKKKTASVVKVVEGRLTVVPQGA